MIYRESRFKVCLVAPDAGFEPATKRLTAAYSTAELIRNKMVRMKGLEPSRREAPDPKSGVSANFTTSAYLKMKLQFYHNNLNNLLNQ